MVLVRLHESDRLTVQFTGVANGFFVPLFFVLLGAELNLRALLTSPSRILLALGLAVGAVITHLIAARVAGHEQYIATGLAASAQLGMPAAAASLGLSAGLLDSRRSRRARRRRLPDAHPRHDRVVDAGAGRGTCFDLGPSPGEDRGSPKLRH